MMTRDTLEKLNLKIAEHRRHSPIRFLAAGYFAPRRVDVQPR